MFQYLQHFKIRSHFETIRFGTQLPDRKSAPSRLGRGKRKAIRMNFIKSGSAMGPADDAERVLCIVPGSVFRPAVSVSGWLALLPGQRPAARPPAARKETILAFRVRARSSGGRRGDQARALLTGEPHLVPIAPMGCRPSPVPCSLPPKAGFVNEQTVNS
jgi:hypothetical protein